MIERFRRYLRRRSVKAWFLLIFGGLWAFIDHVSNLDFLYTRVFDGEKLKTLAWTFIGEHEGLLQSLMIATGFLWLYWTGREERETPLQAHGNQPTDVQPDTTDLRFVPPVLAVPEWRSHESVTGRRNMTLRLERLGHGPEPRQITCIVEGPGGSTLMGTQPTSTISSAYPPKIVYAFDYPKDFNGQEWHLPRGVYHIIWEARADATAVPMRVVDTRVTPPVLAPPALEVFRTPDKAPFLETIVMEGADQKRFERRWLRVGIRNTADSEVKRIRVVLESFEPRNSPAPIEHDLWPMDRPKGTRDISLLARGVAYVNVAYEDAEEPGRHGVFSFCYAQEVPNSLPSLELPYELILRVECDVAPPERWKLLLGGGLGWRLDSLELL